MLDHDAGLTAHDALDLEPHRALGARRERAHRAGAHLVLQGTPLQGLADLVQFDAQRPRHQPDLPAPHHGRDPLRQHQRLVVHRVPHPDQMADRILLLVRGVVEDLLAADRLHLGAQTADQQRQHVVAPAGIDPGDEEGAAALGHGRQERVPQLRRGVALVVERIEGGRDDHRARPDRPPDVGECAVGTDVAGRRVEHRAGAGCQNGGDVVGGRDPDRASGPAELARVAADLGGIVHEDGGEFQCRMGLDGADRRAADVAGTPDNRGNHARRVAPPPCTSQSRDTTKSSPEDGCRRPGGDAPHREPLGPSAAARTTRREGTGARWRDVTRWFARRASDLPRAPERQQPHIHRRSGHRAAQRGLPPPPTAGRTRHRRRPGQHESRPAPAPTGPGGPNASTAAAARSGNGSSSPVPAAPSRWGSPVTPAARSAAMSGRVSARWAASPAARRPPPSTTGATAGPAG